MKVRGPKSKCVPPQLAPFREVARSAIKRHNARHASRPKCGAKRKHDGQPCQHPAMANGRCYFHGGVTPRGKDWHKVCWPTDPEKFNRKLKDRERIEARRKQRVAAMSEEERAIYERRRSACRPGTPAQRAARRAQRKQATEAARILQPRKASVDQAQAALTEEIEALKAKAARLKQSRSQMTEGVFG